MEEKREKGGEHKVQSRRVDEGKNDKLKFAQEKFAICHARSARTYSDG